jgi:4a-hydroxytetrahydrobiopterin dehydratase
MRLNEVRAMSFRSCTTTTQPPDESPPGPFGIMIFWHSDRMAERDLDAPLSRTAASAAVADIGWRYLLDDLAVSVPVQSLAQGSAVAAAAVAAGGADADGHLRVDLRPDRVELSVRDRNAGRPTTRDTELAHRIAAAVAGLGLAGSGSTSAESPRPVQALEVAIDALDIPGIQPFWKAVLGYVDQFDGDDPTYAIVDPAGQLPSLWFQQMDAPRTQRNRVHFDITVAHDEAEPRVRAALAAGGRLVDDSNARAYWVLADAEGNEVCVCAWTGRDAWDQ